MRRMNYEMLCLYACVIYRLSLGRRWITQLSHTAVDHCQVSVFVVRKWTRWLLLEMEIACLCVPKMM